MITPSRILKGLALVAAGAILGTILAPGATAQAPYAYPPSYPPVYYPYRSSTIGESYARGWADVVRSAGAANLLNSEAAKNYEDARARYFDNRLKWTQTYFEMRQMNQEYRQEMRGQRPTSEQLFRIAQERAPSALEPSQLDPYSGEIQWPELLLAPEYEIARNEVERLVQMQMTDEEALSVDQRQSLRAALNQLAGDLKSNLSAYSAQEYAQAKRFLQSLSHTVGAGAL